MGAAAAARRAKGRRRIGVAIGVPARPIRCATEAPAAPNAGRAMSPSDALSIQLAGQPALPLRATSASEFMVDQVGAKVAFTTTAGKIGGLTIEQGGRTLPGTRD